MTVFQIIIGDITFKITEMKVELEFERHKKVVSPLAFSSVTALIMAGC